MAAVPNIMLKQVRVDHLTMFKVAASGQAGRSGVFAAMLARAGMEGPHLPFEGRAGWCEHGARERLSLDALGNAETPFKILATRFKTRPCAGNTISSVLAAEKIAPLQNSGDVDRISVEVYKRAKIASGSDAHFWNPDSPGTADHSIPYLVAVALLDGTITPRSFDNAHLHNTAVRSLMTKLEVVENADFTRAYEQLPQAHYTRVTVLMRDGSKSVGQSGGGADDLAADKTDAQIAAKFSSLVKPALGDDGAARALDQLWRLETMQNVTCIAPLFVVA
jgi:2-methylcitrate dehydratase